MEWIASWSVWISSIGGIIVIIGAVGAWYQQNREQARTLDAITGGKSYCIAHVGSPDDPAGALLTLKHSGDFPLYDLVAYVADQGEVKVRGSGEHATGTAPVEFENALRYHVGTLAVKTRTTLPRLRPATGEHRSVIIRFAARNGVWSQVLDFRRVDSDRWKVTIHAFRDDEPMKSIAMFEEYVPAFKGKSP